MNTLTLGQRIAAERKKSGLSQESLGNFDYVLNHFFVVDPNTTIDSSQLNAAALLDDDLTLEADGENPQILICLWRIRRMLNGLRRFWESVDFILPGNGMPTIMLF